MRFLLLLGLLINLSVCLAQSDYVFVDSIGFAGLKKTKHKLLEREQELRVGDSLKRDEMAQVLEANVKLLKNTLAFSSVKYDVEWTDAYRFKLVSTLVEEFPIYPIPYVELADRNFNEWWQQHDHDIKRVNLALNTYFTNPSGNLDRLKVGLQVGYTKKYELEYVFPYINKKNTIGLFFNTLYTSNKELSYATVDDELLFKRDDDKPLFKSFRFQPGILLKPKIHFSQALKFGFHYDEIAQKALLLNPNYFRQGTRQRYLSIDYSLKFDYRDIVPYPLNGYVASFQLVKKGVGVYDDLNTLHASIKAAKYWSFSKRLSFDVLGKASTNLIDENPGYYNSRALGYDDDYIRGNELYVTDGESYFYTKESLRFNAYRGVMNFGKAMPIKAFKVMPTEMFFTLNFDQGYVSSKYYHLTNDLTNRMLYGGGVGLDLLFFNDVLLSTEYSFNDLGENGLFLHFKLDF